MKTTLSYSKMTSQEIKKHILYLSISLILIILGTIGFNFIFSIIDKTETFSILFSLGNLIGLFIAMFLLDYNERKNLYIDKLEVGRILNTIDFEDIEDLLKSNDKKSYILNNISQIVSLNKKRRNK